MKLFGYAIVKQKDLPFHREVDRLISKHPEYLKGIADGVVHLAFDPGHKPKEPAHETIEVNEGAGMEG